MSNIKVNKNASRRDLLKMAGGCAALTNTSLLSTIINLSATNSVVADVPLGDAGYKALVCVFLFGGNDSFNMLSPATTDERTNYISVRGGLTTEGEGGLALPSNLATEITDSASGRKFMIHPSMPEVKELYDNDKLTFLCNVGSLVQPTTRTDYQAGVNNPLGLFSHSDLQQHWMTTVPQSRSQVNGWAGRMADLITDSTNSNENVSMNIALNDVNMMQTGRTVVPYIIRDSGAIRVNWYGGGNRQQRVYTQLTDDVLSRSYGNLIEQTFAGMNRNALDAAIEFNEATNAIESVDEYFTGTLTRFQLQMRRIAKTIGAHGEGENELKQKRQIFFVGVGGWDMHDELIDSHEDRLGDVSKGLKFFQDAMDSLGLTDDVVTFTASDFARTLNGNGAGSDHAWGGNQIIMGGPVAGGRIHGKYPTNLVNPFDDFAGDIDLGRGRLMPTTSVDEMAAELAMWYGIPNDNNLELVLPNIRNFDTAASGTHPIGILT